MLIGNTAAALRKFAHLDLVTIKSGNLILDKKTPLDIHTVCTDLVSISQENTLYCLTLSKPTHRQTDRQTDRQAAAYLACGNHGTYVVWTLD